MNHLPYFKDLTTLSRPSLNSEIRDRLIKTNKNTNGKDAKILAQATKNPSIKAGQYRSEPEGNGNGGGAKAMASRRYYVPSEDSEDWPPELNAYNKKFAETLERIKRRHDSVVTTVGKLDNSFSDVDHH
jgi:pyruvate dehydrogenase kinase 2/3/4